MVEKKSGLENPVRDFMQPKNLQWASVETTSMGGENAPHSDYQEAGRNYNVYQLWKPKPLDFHAAT